MKIKLAAAALFCSVAMCCSTSFGFELLDRMLAKVGCTVCENANARLATHYGSGCDSGCGGSASSCGGGILQSGCGGGGLLSGGCGGGGLLSGGCGGGLLSGGGLFSGLTGGGCGGGLLSGGSCSGVGILNSGSCDSCGSTSYAGASCGPTCGGVAASPCGGGSCGGGLLSKIGGGGLLSGGCGGGCGSPIGGGLMSKLGNVGCGSPAGGCGCSAPAPAPVASCGCSAPAPAPVFTPAPAVSCGCSAPAAPSCGGGCGGGLLSNLGGGGLLSRVGGGGCGCSAPAPSCAPAPVFTPAPAVSCGGCGQPASSCGCGAARGGQLRGRVSGMVSNVGGRLSSIGNSGCGCSAPAPAVSSCGGGCGGSCGGGCGSAGRLSLLDRLRGNRIPRDRDGRVLGGTCNDGCNPPCPQQNSGCGCGSTGGEVVYSQPNAVAAPMSSCSSCGGGSVGGEVIYGDSVYGAGSVETAAPVIESGGVIEGSMNAAPVTPSTTTPAVDTPEVTPPAVEAVKEAIEGASITPVVDPNAFIIRGGNVAGGN